MQTIVKILFDIFLFIISFIPFLKIENRKKHLTHFEVMARRSIKFEKVMTKVATAFGGYAAFRTLAFLCADGHRIYYEGAYTASGSFPSTDAIYLIFGGYYIVSISFFGVFFFIALFFVYVNWEQGTPLIKWCWKWYRKNLRRAFMAKEGCYETYCAGDYYKASCLFFVFFVEKVYPWLWQKGFS